MIQTLQGAGRRIAECLTQEARDVACGPHPAFRTPPFALPRRATTRHPTLVTRHRLKFGSLNFPEVWSLKFGVSPRSAFTMIEIAISLAVIGFALVAIIGILPTGMNVQKENREE